MSEKINTAQALYQIYLALGGTEPEEGFAFNTASVLMAIANQILENSEQDG